MKQSSGDARLLRLHLQRGCLAILTWEIWWQGGSVPRACEAIDFSMELPQQGFCLWIDVIHPALPIQKVMLCMAAAVPCRNLCLE